MKRFITALVLALSLAAGTAQAQLPGYSVAWACTTYLFGIPIQEAIVWTDGSDPGNTSWTHLPYSVWCVYLLTCDTTFNPADGTYVTYCN